MSHQDDISQIKKYLNGELDARAMHELERRALDDPFLMDALEGYEHAQSDQQANLDELSERLQKRTDKKVIRMIPWGPMSIAASVLILLGAGILFLTKKSAQPVKQDIALFERPNAPAEKSLAVPQAGATGNNTAKDSTGVGNIASNDKKLTGRAYYKSSADNSVANKDIAEPPALAETQFSSPKFAGAPVKKKDTSYSVNEYSMGYNAKQPDTFNNKITYKRAAPANTDQIIPSRVNGVTINTPQGRDKAREDEAKRLLGVNEDHTDVLKQNLSVNKARQTDTGDLDEKVIGSQTSKISRNGQASPGLIAQGSQPITQSNDGSGRTISGHIKSKDDGQPIIGATVKVVGKPFGVVSDVNGKYILKNVPDNASLIVSYIGYNAMKTKVTQADTLDVALFPNNASLSEVVVTSKEPVVYEIAQPTQGWVAFKKYVDEKAVSPDSKTGKVHLSFTIGANGDVSNIQVTKSLSKDADQKAIDIVKSNGNWYPATDRKPQKVKLTIKFHQ